MKTINYHDDLKYKAHNIEWFANKHLTKNNNELHITLRQWLK